MAILFLLARYLGQSAFGRYAVAYAIPMALEALADLGISQAMVRAAAGRPEALRRDFSAAVPIKLLLALLTVVGSYAIAVVLELPGEIVEMTVYLAIAKAFESLTYLARSVFQARERMGYEALSVVLDGATRVAFVVYALASGFGLVGLAKALAVSAAIVLLATVFVAIRRFVGALDWRSSPGVTLGLLRIGLPLGLVWLLDVLPMRMDVVLVGQLEGDRAAGIFAAAIRLIEPVTIIPYTMAVALLPLATRHLSERMTTLPSLFQATMKLALAVSLAGTIGLVGTSAAVVRTLFGPEFQDAAPLVALLSVALVPLFVDTILAGFLAAFYEQRKLVLTQALGVATNLLVALIGIPLLGISAVAVAVVVGEVVSVGAAFAGVARLRLLVSMGILKVFAAAGPAAALLFLADGIGPIAATVVSLVAYAALLGALGVFDPAERAYIRASVLPIFGGRTLPTPTGTRH